MSDMYLTHYEPDTHHADHPQCCYDKCINPADFKVNVRQKTGSAPIGQLYFCEYHRANLDNIRNNFYLNDDFVMLTDIPRKRTNIDMHFSAPLIQTVKGKP